MATMMFKKDQTSANQSAQQNSSFSFQKQTELIQRAKKLQASSNHDHSVDPNAYDYSGSSQTKQTWKFVQQRDSGLEFGDSSRNRLTQGESNEEESFAKDDGELDMTRTADYRGKQHSEYIQNNILYRSGDTTGDYVQSEAPRHTSNTLLNSDGVEDSHSIETNSQYAYDQGRPDLLERLRGIQGFSNGKNHEQQHPRRHQQPSIATEPQILNAPRKFGTMPATMKNKLNLQIEIESQNDNGRKFSEREDYLESDSFDQIDQECIKISDLVQQQQLQQQQRNQTLDIQLDKGADILLLPKQKDSHSRTPQCQMTIEVPGYRSTIPVAEIEDVHALPSSVQNTRSQVRSSHGRYQSSQGNISSQNKYNQLQYYGGSQHNGAAAHKNSVGQDSSTIYKTCFGSSNEKYGRHTMSFYTANSQMVLQNSNEEFYDAREEEEGFNAANQADADEEAKFVSRQNAEARNQRQNEVTEEPDEQPYFYEASSSNNPMLSQKQKFIQKATKTRPESAKELHASLSKSKNSSAAKRRGHQGHTSSFNMQGQRSSRDVDNANIPPMLNQFSFGHLQSSEGQACAVSEHHARENDSIKLKNNTNGQQDAISISGLQHQALSLDSQLGLSVQTSTDDKIQELVALNQDLQQHQQNNAPYSSIEQTHRQLEHNELYQQIYAHVRQQLQANQQNLPDYQLRQNHEEQRLKIGQPLSHNQQTHQRNATHKHQLSTSDQKYEEFMLQKAKIGGQPQHRAQSKKGTAAQQAPLNNSSIRPPKPIRMRKPETFNESMYQRSQAWLQQKEQRVQIQKRESALKEAEECTFEPNKSGFSVDRSSQPVAKEGRRRSGRRGFNSTQRSKRSQVRQRDQLIYHHGHHQTVLSNQTMIVTPQSNPLSQTIQFNQKSGSFVNAAAGATTKKEHSSDSGQYVASTNPRLSQSHEESHCHKPSHPQLNILIDPLRDRSQSRNSNNNFNAGFVQSNQGGHQQHFSMVSSIVPSQFSNTMRVKSSSPSADLTAKCTTKTTERQQQPPPSQFMREPLDSSSNRYPYATISQDGNLMSVRAIESYRKHLERQTYRLDRKIEEEEAELKKPGSGNLWQYKLTKPSSPKLRSLERSKLKQYAKTKIQFLKGEGLASGRSRSASRDSKGNMSTIFNTTMKANNNKTINGMCLNLDLSANIKPPNETQQLEMMSVLCQSTNLQESLEKAKQGLHQVRDAKGGYCIKNGVKVPRKRIKSISQLKGKQEQKTYLGQMMAQKQFRSKNSSCSRTKTTNYIRPKSSQKKPNSCHDPSKRVPGKAQKPVKQQQLNNGSNQQPYMTCQSTISNYGKQSELVQVRNMNPHSSIMTQMLPEAVNHDPLFLQMTETQKSNTQIIDISQFNTLNEHMNNASCNLHSSTPTHNSKLAKANQLSNDRSLSSKSNQRMRQARSNRPKSQLLSGSDAITSGGCTVEVEQLHAGAAGAPTDEDASYMGDVDFLNHFGAHQSSIGVGGGGETPQQMQMMVSHSVQSHPGNNILSINKSKGRCFEGPNKQYRGNLDNCVDYQSQQQQRYHQQLKGQSNQSNRLNPALFESFNPQYEQPQQATYQSNRSSSGGQNEYGVFQKLKSSIVVNPHLQVIEEHRRSSNSNFGGCEEQNSESVMAPSEADSNSVKNFIRSQIGAL